MNNTYLGCVILGALPLASLLVLTVFGFGGDAADNPLHTEPRVADKLLILFGFGGDAREAEIRSTYRFLTLAALPAVGLIGFGLGGFIAIRQGWPNPNLIGIIGAVSLVVPVPLLSWIGSRRAPALARFLGQDGIVSEPIPARYTGAGAVMIVSPSGPVTVPAVTAGGEIPAGAHVVVRGLFNRSVIEVDALDQMLLQGLPPVKNGPP